MLSSRCGCLSSHPSVGDYWHDQSGHRLHGKKDLVSPEVFCSNFFFFTHQGHDNSDPTFRGAFAPTTCVSRHVPCPLQCRRSGRFGDVSSTCRLTVACTRSSGSHYLGEYKAESLCWRNYRDHMINWIVTDRADKRNVRSACARFNGGSATAWQERILFYKTALVLFFRLHAKSLEPLHPAQLLSWHP